LTDRTQSLMNRTELVLKAKTAADLVLQAKGYVSCNEYHFGSFKGNPDASMEKYFDGFLYLANWGTRELQLAFPQRPT